MCSWMKKSLEESERIKMAKIELGKLIKDLHDSPDGKTLSLRQVAQRVGVKAPNLMHIENGVNAPSPDAYEAIINFFKPDDDYRKQMDYQYSIIRGTPPPDVCKIICANEGLNNALRVLNNQTLTDEQIAEVTALLTSFKICTTEGAATNGQDI